MFYIDDFKKILTYKKSGEDAIKTYTLAIERENNDIEKLEQERNKYNEQFIELEESFKEKFKDIFERNREKISCSYYNYAINLDLVFFDKIYSMFKNKISAHMINPEDLSTLIISVCIIDNIADLNFDKDIKELSSLYAKYEVDPSFIENHLLKIYNGQTINKLQYQIRAQKENIEFSEACIKTIQDLLNNKDIKPSLFNKIFRKKLLSKQEEQQKHIEDIKYYKNLIQIYERDIAEIEQNPQTSMPIIKYELENLSNFLDIYELILETKNNISYEKKQISDINSKIEEKRKWINDYRRSIETHKSQILEYDSRIDDLCEKLSKDKFTLEMCRNENDETVKFFLEYYEAYIEKTIKQIF